MKIYIIAAITADGFIAQNKQQLIDWTSKEDKKFFRDTTKQSGVMIMGGNTYRTFKEPLPDRKHIVYTRGAIENKFFEKTAEAPKDLIKRLKNEGFSEIAIIGGSSIYSMFLEAKVVTDVYLTVEPLFFGEGVKLLNEKISVQLQLQNVSKLNDSTILIHYKVK